jgi:hypothetical protein
MVDAIKTKRDLKSALLNKLLPSPSSLSQALLIASTPCSANLRPINHSPYCIALPHLIAKKKKKKKTQGENRRFLQTACR